MKEETESRGGRPPEGPMTDYYSTQEAARILDRSDETIRNWIRSGRLDGGRYVTRAGETRYQASKDSVEAEAESMGRTVTAQEVEQAVHAEAEASVENVIAALEAAMDRQTDKVIQSLSTEVVQNRDAVWEVAQNLAQMHNALIDRQNQSLDVQRQTLALLSRVEKTEQERNKQGKIERRSFWRRIFTSSAIPPSSVPFSDLSDLANALGSSQLF